MDIQEIRRVRLAQLIDAEYGGSQAAFVEATGENQGEVSGLLKTKSFGEKKARKLELKCELPIGWLDSFESIETSFRPLESLGSDDIEIPQFATGGAMGHGLALTEQPGVIKSWRVDHEWLRLNVKRHTGAKNLCIVTGFGPSMRPLFNPGDPLLVDRGVTSFDDEDAVYFFRVGDHGFIKTVQRIPRAEGGIIYRAKSKNPDFDSFDITAGMDFEVFGKVLTVWKSEQL
ncbi:S24 family peptidase [Glaciimonas sp. PCH181]|uniref:S24 family peptidase n=1 Tax=Glaciimonas sp. PCH181 TaxID=2133943 RepID=UPI000D37275F|nr:S24 family peptidase [Glaciimonas sp. PCH181]PUA17297.1 transcriptional regulator [Glaciimonas sp. PCH181]